jgi:hypothetical protein
VTCVEPSGIAGSRKPRALGHLTDREMPGVPGS